MKKLLALSTFLVITSLATTVNAQKADAEGNTTTTVSSDKYGPGGTHSTTSDKKYQLRHEVYKDKCGRVREEYSRAADKSDYDRREYYDENGKRVLETKNGGPIYSGGPYYYSFKPNYHEIGTKEGKALIAKLEKTPSAPCPEKAGQAKEEPQPKGNPLNKVLEHVNIGIGIGGGHTVGHDEHGRSGKSTGYKSLPAGCKCHPCTCSPLCHCGG